MKYIRTKEGRILKGSNYGFGVGMPYKNYDVKVANTIEELCDEFVRIAKGFKPTILPDKNSKYLSLNKHEDYGAIWTPKGLIYVAKMKGILPNGEIDWELL